MLLSMYSIYDTAVKAWMSPMYFRNKGDALRWFGETVNNPESRLSKHPTDFVFFELGTWDDEKCIFDIQEPVRLGVAMEFIKSVV